METRTETRIERVSGSPTTLFAAANSVSVTKEALKLSMMSGTISQIEMKHKRIKVAESPSPT